MLTGSRFFHQALLIFSSLAITVFALSARAGISLPKNMSASDRESALRIIGFGTSGKILSNPYPMGGYAGFEAGLAIEDVPTEGLGRLGDGLTSTQQDVALPKLTIGKGLYNNVDFFIDFTPYNRQDELSQFGGLLRWGFYQANFLPVNGSLVLHANSGAIGNQMTDKSYGADLVAGMNVNNVALFAGAGMIQATGTFLGSLTEETAVESNTVTGLHTVVGANIDLKDAFVALQMDRYATTVFSGKVGVRF